MGVSKVEFGGDTLIDLTEDSVTPETMMKGTTAHNSAGEPIEGTFDPDIYQTKTDDSLETDDKSVVGAINELNGKSLANAENISVAGDIEWCDSDGIWWDASFYVTKDEGDTEIADIPAYTRLPLVAGDNVTFDVVNSDSGSVVKINATGGGGTENAVLIFPVDTAPPTTMSAIITAIQDGGGDITEYNYVQLNGFFKGLLLMKFQYYGGNTYKATCNDIINGYKIYNASTDNVCDVTSKGIREFLEEGKPVAMPIIRFANFQDINGAMYLTEDNPFTFTVEVTGGGELQWGDLLQICVRRKYWYRTPTGEFKHKWKLRSVVQREITDEDFGKRFLSINVTLGDVESRGNWLFRNDRKPLRADGTIDTHSYMYFRIKRVTQYGSNGEECNAIFSNVEKVAKTYAPHIRHLTIK